MSFKAKLPANKTGRPLAIKSPQEMIEKFNEYEEQRKKERKPLTHPGITLYCGLTTLRNYKKKDEFLQALERIDKEIEHSVLEYSLEGDRQRKWADSYFNRYFGGDISKPPQKREPVVIILQDKRRDRELEVKAEVV